MPYRFDVDHDSRIITRRTWGKFTDSEAIDARREFAAIPESEVYNELYDYLGVTEYLVATETVKQLATESVAQEGPDFAGKKVAIVSNGDLTYGLLRMYQAYHDASMERIEFFERLAPAVAWLREPALPDDDQVAGAS